ncbi:MAG: hypothetical protein NPIRA02_41680 [Nitrospirales bacterium]|nr:MAG: hypothetical protein NPIRA02_41680 [Nitrospirales bacterium]
MIVGWLMSAGCGGGAAVESTHGNPPPSWLTTLPQERDTLCATGISGPTYYPEEAFVNSKTQGLSELGRSLRSHVKSRMLVQEHGGSADFSHVQIEDAVALSSEEILEKSEVRSRWVNPGGYPAHGTKGTVYTLICTPLS